MLHCSMGTTAQDYKHAAAGKDFFRSLIYWESSLSNYYVLFNVGIYIIKFHAPKGKSAVKKKVGNWQ
jgi:hypothetical protein